MKGEASNPPSKERNLSDLCSFSYADHNKLHRLGDEDEGGDENPQNMGRDRSGNH